MPSLSLSLTLIYREMSFVENAFVVVCIPAVIIFAQYWHTAHVEICSTIVKIWNFTDIIALHKSFEMFSFFVHIFCVQPSTFRPHSIRYFVWCHCCLLQWWMILLPIVRIWSCYFILCLFNILQIVIFSFGFSLQIRLQ